MSMYSRPQRLARCNRWRLLVQDGTFSMGDSVDSMMIRSGHHDELSHPVRPICVRVCRAKHLFGVKRVLYI
jgi:hypothetical protein